MKRLYIYPDDLFQNCFPLLFPRERDLLADFQFNPPAVPYQYHNGGIWLFVGSFWVLLLHSLGRDELAVCEPGRVAVANRQNSGAFTNGSTA